MIRSHETDTDDILPASRATTGVDCQRVLQGFARVKRSLLRGSGNDFDRLLQLAINEAEALAWESGFPHLLFPALAEEKARAVAEWQVRQEAIRLASTIQSFAA